MSTQACGAGAGLLGFARVDGERDARAPTNPPPADRGGSSRGRSASAGGTALTTADRAAPCAWRPTTNHSRPTGCRLGPCTSAPSRPAWLFRVSAPAGEPARKTRGAGASAEANPGSVLWSAARAARWSGRLEGVQKVVTDAKPDSEAGQRSRTAKPDSEAGQRSRTAKPDSEAGQRSRTAKPDSEAGQRSRTAKPDSEAGQRSRTAKPDSEAGQRSRTAKPDSEAGQRSRTAKPDSEAGQRSRTAKPDSEADTDSEAECSCPSRCFTSRRSGSARCA